MPDGVVIAAYLPREDVRDALISALADRVEDLPRGATFGAASLRRQAQALRLRPDLKPVLLRGNVETRLRKAESGEVGATLLALAGLKRLGLDNRARAVLDIDEFLPAPGQGAIALTARRADARALEALKAVSDGETAAALAAERAFLAELEGSCRTPIAGLARLGHGGLRLQGRGSAHRRLRALRHRRRGRPCRRRASRARGWARSRRPPSRGRARQGLTTWAPSRLAG